MLYGLHRLALLGNPLRGFANPETLHDMGMRHRRARLAPPNHQIGRRIHVVGNSCSGKSVLGKQLATALQVPFVELDALNWRPSWVGLSDTNPEEFERLIGRATDGARKGYSRPF